MYILRKDLCESQEELLTKLRLVVHTYFSVSLLPVSAEVEVKLLGQLKENLYSETLYLCPFSFWY